MSASANQMSSSSMPQGTSPWNNSKYGARVFFDYESDSLPVAPNGIAPGVSVQESFNIAGDSDFFWTKFAATALGTPANAATYTFAPAVSILITNTTTGRQYSSSSVPLPNLAGNGQFPFILPQITWWQAKSTIQIQLQNLSADVTYSNILLTFHGVKAFPMGAT